MATFIVHVYDKESKHGTRRDGALIYSTDGAPPRTDYRVNNSIIHFILDMYIVPYSTPYDDLFKVTVS